MNAQPTMSAKPARSMPLTKAQLAYLDKVVANSESITQAGITLGISKDVLSRTLAFGSCSEKTYNTLFKGAADVSHGKAA